MARPLSSHPLYRAYISPTLKNESRVSREAELVSGNQVQRRAGSEMLESEKREGPTTRFYQHSHSSLLPWEKLSTIPKRDLPMLKFRDTKWKSWLAIFSFNSSPEDKPTLVWTVPNSFKVSHFKLQIDRQRSLEIRGEPPIWKLETRTIIEGEKSFQREKKKIIPKDWVKE